jgi:hypothetical protein
LTVLQAYLQAGQPDVGLATRGSFERWIALIAGAIRWAGGPDVVAGAWLEQNEPEEDHEDLLVLLRWLLAAFPDGATAKQILEKLQEPSKAGGQSWLILGVVKQLLGLKAEPEITSRLLGLWFRQHRDQIVGGLRLRGRPGHGKTRTWWIEE